MMISSDKLKPLKLDPNERRIWFTSDLHFSHKNIIKFCNRPFKDIEEMNKALIDNWNSVVGEDDIVFNLGDFSYASKKEYMEILCRLKGIHYLIRGNHDRSRNPGIDILKLFYRVEDQMILSIDGYNVILNHYPLLCYGGAYRTNTINLFGHVHSGPNATGKDISRLDMLFPTQYDVGVDNNNYTPVSWERVKEIIEERLINNT